MKENIFVQFLLDNHWKEINAMSYESMIIKNLKILFDTSNQIDLYFGDKKLDDCYVRNINDLVEFINEHTSLEIPNQI